MQVPPPPWSCIASLVCREHHLAYLGATGAGFRAHKRPGGRLRKMAMKKVFLPCTPQAPATPRSAHTFSHKPAQTS